MALVTLSLLQNCRATPRTPTSKLDDVVGSGRLHYGTVCVRVFVCLVAVNFNVIINFFIFRLVSIQLRILPSKYTQSNRFVLFGKTLNGVFAI